MPKLSTLLGCCTAILTSMASISAGPLVINEIDYDQPGSDDFEFVEIFNAGSTYIPLEDVALVFINGANNSEYRREELLLAGGIFPGQYVLVCNGSLNPSIASAATVLNFSGFNNNIQNGSPDGIALINFGNNTVLDTVSYEGGITTANIIGLGVINLVQGTPIPLAVADDNTGNVSLSCLPNGAGSGNDSADWGMAVPTPGAANSCIAPTVQRHPGSLESCVGGSATFEAVFDLFRPDINPPTFLWRVNGSPVNLLDPRVSVVNTSFGSRLTITNLTMADAISGPNGFVCKMSYICGDIATTPASLTVAPTCCIGDLNVDGFVDDADFVIFAAAYEILDCADPIMPPGCWSDFNGDGFVDDADFVIFAGAYEALLCP